jgi:ferredoxin
MDRLRLPVIALLLLWLPLQAVAAVAMPFCTHGWSQTTLHGGSGHDHHHDPSQPASHHHASGPQDCNGCGACNLACAPAIPASAALLSPPPVTAPLQLHLSRAGLFIPEQPQPPPDSRI